MASVLLLIRYMTADVYVLRVSVEQVAYTRVGKLFACQYVRTKLQNWGISSEVMSARRVMRTAD